MRIDPRFIPLPPRHIPPKPSSEPLPPSFQDVVIFLAKWWLSHETMKCEVCGQPATKMWENPMRAFPYSKAYCDVDAGNREAREDYRAPMIRTVQAFLKEHKK